MLTERDPSRRARHRLAVLRHVEEASGGVAATCRYYGISRQCENIWLRTKRHDANGQVKSGSGGVCYLYFPAKPSGTQRRALAELGIR